MKQHDDHTNIKPEASEPSENRILGHAWVRIARIIAFNQRADLP